MPIRTTLRNGEIVASTTKTKTAPDQITRRARSDLQSAGCFRLFARQASAVLGTAWAFVIAIGIIVVWAGTGRIFNYSDTWQLIINHRHHHCDLPSGVPDSDPQNRDSKAVHLKLDELIRAVGGARNHMVDLERLSTRSCGSCRMNLRGSARRRMRPRRASNRCKTRSRQADPEEHASACPWTLGNASKL